MTRPALTLHAAIETYLSDMAAQGMKESTLKQHRSTLRRLSRFYAGRKLRGIESRDLYRFLYGPDGIANGKSGITASCQRSALRKLWQYADLMGWAPEIRVPLPHVPTSRGSVQTPPTRLTKAQLRLLLAAAEETNPRVWGMLAVGINTALRVSDVLKVRLGHIELQTGSLNVWVQKTQKFDAMPVTRDLDDALRRYLTWYTRETGATISEHPDAFLIPGFAYARNTGRKGWPGWKATVERPPTYAWAHGKLKSLLDESGVHVERKEAWHSIRRSVARIYFDDLLASDYSYAEALRMTQAWLGHAKASTTETYIGIQAEILARNESLRGKPFLGPSDEDVVPLRRAF